MTIRIGVCAAPDAVASAVEGLDYLEPSVGWLLCPAEDEAAFARRLAVAKAAAVASEAVNCLLPGSMKSTGPDVDEEALDAYLRTVCDRAARAGVQCIVYGSGGSRRVPEGFAPSAAAEQIAGHLGRWGVIAAAAGVTIVLEPLNVQECNIATSVDEAAELVRRADHPAARLLIDTYHMGCNGEGPDAIRRAGGLIAHAHCADRNGRVPVGLGPEDQRPYFRALKDIGYDGRLSIEAKIDDLDAELPEAVRRLREQWDGA